MPSTVPPVEHAVERLENAGPLDPVVKAVRSVVTSALRSKNLRDVLHGVWLGHPLHPMLTDVPVGTWTAATVVDMLPGTGPAATALIATGCAAAVPTAVTGWADWSQLHPPQQRVGVVHAAANIVGLACYTASLAARLGGHHARGKGWALAGLGAVSVGGYLGGHLGYRQSAGANHQADVPDLFPSGWHEIGRIDELPEGKPTRRTVGEVGLVVVRRGQHVDALSDRCSHLSGPLSEGEFTSEGGQGCVVCPWHGSTFRLSDGAVVHGPATSPQVRFVTRVTGGVVEVSLRGDG